MEGEVTVNGELVALEFTFAHYCDLAESSGSRFHALMNAVTQLARSSLNFDQQVQVRLLS